MHGTPPLDHQASPAWIHPKTPEASPLTPERWRTPQPLETCVWHYSPVKREQSHNSPQPCFTKLLVYEIYEMWWHVSAGVIVYRKITFCPPIQPSGTKYFLHTYLSDHFIRHVHVRFARKWDHHIIYIVPSLGPHVSWVRVRKKTYLRLNNSDLLWDTPFTGTIGNACIQRVHSQ